MNQHKMLLFNHWYECVATEDEQRACPNDRELYFMKWYIGTQDIKRIAKEHVDEAEARFQKAAESKAIH
jgi:hypothetical protein